MSARIAVVGEAIVDLVGGADRVTYTARPGGSPANVAVGLARLGVPVELHTRLGADALGAMLRAHLERNGVALPGPAPTGVSTVAAATIGADGVAAYDFWLTPTLEAPWPQLATQLPDTALDRLAALHAGSVAAWREPSAADVTALLERARGRTLISLDPNCRPRLATAGARERIRTQVALADIVKVSREDLDWLAPGVPPDQVAADWLARGPVLVVVTDGAAGAYGAVRTGAVQVDAPPVAVVDTVGAGDAFTAALLAGLADRGALDPAALGAGGVDLIRDVLTLACRAAALTCTRVGADPPTRAALTPP